MTSWPVLDSKRTRGIFPGHESTTISERSVTCNDPAHLAWLLSLKERGFEMGWHGASPGTSVREQTVEGLDRFRQFFGDQPITISQHYACIERYPTWGDERLSFPPHRFVYNLLTRWRNHNAFHGHVPGHRHYWGDLCRERIRYVRNFAFADINTLKACPYMPYHDPDRPDVNLWYASAEGRLAVSFNRTLSEENQDRLEAEGGACIMYTHFGSHTLQDGQLNKEFGRLMERLSKKNGWFVPVGTLLDYIVAQRGAVLLNPQQRQILERRWLIEKISAYSVYSRVVDAVWLAWNTSPYRYKRA